MALARGSQDSCQRFNVAIVERITECGHVDKIDKVILPLLEHLIGRLQRRSQIAASAAG